ncbi:hypothetical protein [Nocardia sp. NPDC051570]|uniref:hypothetical protein n=1 Tax=Nocardia sp. NPDC051570 TaxID=3364324 RepID=UPI0037934DC3
MSIARNIVVPVVVPVHSGALSRAVVAFAVMMAFAVLAMLVVVALFPGPNLDTSTTTRVSTTHLFEPAQACYPFGDCTPEHR